MKRNDIDFQRGNSVFVKDAVEIFPASRDEHAFGLSFSGMRIEQISEALTDQSSAQPFSQPLFVTNDDHME